MLSTHPIGRFGPQIRLEQPQHRPQDRQARQPEVPALVFKPADQHLIEQGIKNDTRRFLDLAQHTIKLLVGAHGRIDVLDRRRIVVLRGSSACDRNQRFAGGIGDEVKMKEARIAQQHRLRIH